MLSGELEYRRGNFDLAFAHLRRAVQFDDSLPTTSRGAGCSRRGMRWARCCWSRAHRGAESVLSLGPRLRTASCAAPASIPRTSGACTGSTNACDRRGDTVEGAADQGSPRSRPGAHRGADPAPPASAGAKRPEGSI
jgi:hypothetical protein